MKATIRRVYPVAREFTGKQGNKLAAVKVAFEDGSEGDVLTTPDHVAEHIEALTKLVGQEHEFTVDAERQREYNGVTQHAIKEYPGKPTGGGAGGGGGGRQFTPAWANTEAGERFVQERTDRRTAVMQAVAYFDKAGTPAVLQAADEFYAWLRATADNTPAPTAQPQQAHATAPSTETWEGPGQCPRCHAPVGKRHGKPCIGSQEDDRPFEG